MSSAFNDLTEAGDSKSAPRTSGGTSSDRRWMQILGVIVAVAVIAVAAWVRYESMRGGYDHPDEVITVKVAEMVVGQHTLNTNWVNADLPPTFKYPQYNFSGYFLF